MLIQCEIYEIINWFIKYDNIIWKEQWYKFEFLILWNKLVIYCLISIRKYFELLVSSNIRVQIIMGIRMRSLHTTQLTYSVILTEIILFSLKVSLVSTLWQSYYIMFATLIWNRHSFNNTHLNWFIFIWQKFDH